MHFGKIVSLFAVSAVLGAAALHAQSDAAAKRTLLRAGHVLDVKTGKVADDQTIVVVADKIQSVQP
ncbi:MAG: hypothetical protein PW735_07820, partial [Acidobacteriaceae bacterium]|nr:hypothetical protein [Acidobacteriaceae bacterium]